MHTNPARSAANFHAGIGGRAIIRIALGIAFATALGAPVNAFAAPRGEVYHVVIFWLKRPDNAADRLALARASEKFRTMRGVRRVEVGNGMPIRRHGIEQRFDMCVVFTFRDRAALHAFEQEPQHKAAVESILKPLVQRFVVFNSVAD